MTEGVECVKQIAASDKWRFFGAFRMGPAMAGGNRRYPELMAQATKATKSTAKHRRVAAERTRGMFAHLAPGVSLADELIAGRRAEAQAEKQADAQR